MENIERILYPKASENVNGAVILEALSRLSKHPVLLVLPGKAIIWVEDSTVTSLYNGERMLCFPLVFSDSTQPRSLYDNAPRAYYHACMFKVFDLGECGKYLIRGITIDGKADTLSKIYTEHFE